MNSESQSLNKFISSKGLCSRREAVKWIEQGRVKINGKVATNGNRVFPGDRVTLDDELLEIETKKVYIMLHKPPGITCTTDLRDKTHIIDFVNFKERIFPIGRLDKSSTGLILLTNDGDIVNRVLRKENSHEKEYIVKVNKPITGQFVRQMSRPIPILGTKTLPAQVHQINKFVFRIILTQDLNRQIRRMCEYCGYRVVSLKRVRVMHIKLGKLPVGQWRFLSDDELGELERRTS